jgi:gamma-glutamyltranspeptidase/glutathione hydrolase
MNNSKKYSSHRSVVASSAGMVATSQPLAAQAGLDVLKAGGNAIDAAVTTAAMLNVVEPMSTGIGGDVFALFYLADGQKVVALNGSGRAPAAATPAYFQQHGYQDVPLYGILPVTVPGTVDAWDNALRTYGSISLTHALAPAIHYAQEGFPVSEIIAEQWHLLTPLLQRNEAATHTYLPGGRAPRFGEIFRQPDLASSLTHIAEFGRDAFYRGSIARAIVQASQELGGLLTLDDLDQHFSTWEEPISTNYRDYTIYECPPNSQGLIALLALNILSQDNLSILDPDSPEVKHLLIEAVRLAMADGYAYISDPSASQVPYQNLLSPTYAQQRRAMIQSDRALTGISAGPIDVGEDTVYLTVVDARGNAASFINSLYHGFGSGVVAGNTGIALQNRGAGFSLQADHPNCIAPGKRPFHTIIPCMVTHNNQLWSSMGVMGGHMQPQGHVQVLTNMIDFGMTPQQALDAPRFEIAMTLDSVALESSMAPNLQQALQQRGHSLHEPGLFGFGGGQVIQIDASSSARLGGSDPRKDSCAIG